MFDKAIEIASSDHTVIGISPFGSDLYNTKLDHHDYDFVVFTADGKSRQLQEGDIDIRILPVEQVLASGLKGSLPETEAHLAMMYGHGIWLDTPWTPMLRSFRPNIWRYGTTVSKYLAHRGFKNKHYIRHQIFLRRFWDTGNADPKLTEEERQEWMSEYLCLQQQSHSE